jgi:molecular chaperone Hsp33
MELYFAQSEQIATRFAVTSAYSSEPGKEPGWRAGGIVIQHLPKASPLMPKDEDAPTGEGGMMSADDVAAMGETADDWATAATKLATVEALELLGPHVAPDTLLLRLFHEDAPRVYDPQAVEFGCTCDPTALRKLLSGYGEETLAEMAENGHISADCQFCGSHYAFALDDLSGAASE